MDPAFQKFAKWCPLISYTAHSVLNGKCTGLVVTFGIHRKKRLHNPISIEKATVLGIAMSG